MNKKYVCKICGWVYDPAEHNNVASGRCMFAGCKLVEEVLK